MCIWRNCGFRGSLPFPASSSSCRQLLDAGAPLVALQLLRKTRASPLRPAGPLTNASSCHAAAAAVAGHQAVTVAGPNAFISSVRVTAALCRVVCCGCCECGYAAWKSAVLQMQCCLHRPAPADCYTPATAMATLTIRGSQGPSLQVNPPPQPQLQIPATTNDRHSSHHLQQPRAPP